MKAILRLQLIFYIGICHFTRYFRKWHKSQKVFPSAKKKPKSQFTQMNYVEDSDLDHGDGVKCFWDQTTLMPQHFNRFSLRTFLCHIWHMSFLTGQDRTPKFVGQVQPDWTESGLIFLTFYLTSISYQFSYDKVPGCKFSIKKSILGNIWKSTKKVLKKKMKNKFVWEFFYFFIFF